MIELQAKEKCFGCGACGAICPREAISFTADAEGYLYPAIDPGKCIQCRLCQKVCPVGKQQPLETGYPKAYAAKHRDEHTLRASSSGGVFSALAQRWATRKGGTVYGAVFTPDFGVQHIRAEEDADWKRMRGSKYPQSRLEPQIYHALERDVRAQRRVLFSGTPCQVAAVRSYLECKHLPADNCLFSDLVCHGAASPAVWQAMLEDISNKYGKPQEISFRAKDEGVSVHLLKIVTEKGDITQQAKREYAFYNVYSSLCMMRPSCYQCPYSSLKRPGDFTMGDYPDLKRQHPDFFSETGVSSLLVNTAKAETQLPDLEQEMDLLAVPLAAVMQQNLEMPTREPTQREKFWDCFAQDGWSGIQKKYGKLSIPRQLIFQIIVPLCRRLGIYNLAVKVYMGRPQKGKQSNRKG